MKPTVEIKYCPVCGKEAAKHGRHYRAFCSKTCSMSPAGKSIISAKTIETCIEKYGATNPSLCKDVQDKRKQHFIDTYGVENPGMLQNVKDLILKAKKTEKAYNTLCERLAQQEMYEPLFSLQQYLDCDYKDELEFKCKDCGRLFRTAAKNFQDIHCGNRCHVKASNGERKMAEYIASLVQEKEILYNKRFYIPNTHRYHELDVYIPEMRLGFEYNGLFWHSTKTKGSNYHLKKLHFFRDLGITITQIFENEWRDRSDIVKSILKSKLQSPEKVLYARKCTIQTAEPSEATDFLERNHLQGATQAPVRIGLYHSGELVQLLTFGKSRFNKKFEWELIRSCCTLGTAIVGGLEKLFKHFITTYKPKSIVSYCDNRWFTGYSYEKVGFGLSHESRPDYFYFKQYPSFNHTLHHRTEFQKHKLTNMPKYDQNMTEKQIMIMNGYLIIEDAGNKVYTWGELDER